MNGKQINDRIHENIEVLYTIFIEPYVNNLCNDDDDGGGDGFDDDDDDDDSGCGGCDDDDDVDTNSNKR